MPLILAVRRQTQADLYEFDVSLTYIMSYRPAKVTQWGLFHKEIVIQIKTIFKIHI